MNSSLPPLKVKRTFEIPRLQPTSGWQDITEVFAADQPVIMTGFARDDWSFVDLSENYGSRPIELFSFDESIGHDDRYRSETIKNVVDDILEKASTLAWYSQWPIDESWAEDLRTKLRVADFSPRPDGAFCWIGGSRTGGIGLHQDPGCRNVVVELTGTKHCVLIDPSQTDLLYPLSYYGDARDLSCTQYDTFRSRATAGRENQGAAGIAWDAFPAIGNTTAHVALLHAGEGLYIPTSWYHVVTNQGANFSLSYRWQNSEWLQHRRSFVALMDLLLSFLRSLPTDHRQAFAARLRFEIGTESYARSEIFAGPLCPPQFAGWSPLRDSLIGAITEIARTLDETMLKEHILRLTLDSREQISTPRSPVPIWLSSRLGNSKESASTSRPEVDSAFAVVDQIAQILSELTRVTGQQLQDFCTHQLVPISQLEARQEAGKPDTSIEFFHWLLAGLRFF